MPRSPVPQPDLLYRDAEKQMLAWIESGRLPPGSRLPSERELGRWLGVNPRTVRRAMEGLVAAGRIIKKPRVGNFVSEAPVQEACTQVAVIAPPYLADLDHPHPAMALFLGGVSQALDSRRYHLATMFYRPECFWEDAGQLLASRGVRGVILWGHHQITPQQVDDLREQGIHTVLHHVDERFVDARHVCVELDRSAALTGLYRHLAELGHRDVRTVRYTHRMRHGESILAELYAQMGVEDWPNQIIPIPNAVFMDDQPLRDVFERSPLPTALVVPDEIVAATVMRLCHQHGVRVPEDLSLVAMGDNTPHLHSVPLTAGSDGQAMMRLGQAAGRCLERLLAGESLDGQIIRIVTECQFRQSTAPPRVGVEVGRQSSGRQGSGRHEAAQQRSVRR